MPPAPFSLHRLKRQPLSVLMVSGRLIKKFYENTGCPIIVNTSFNVRGEPIVCTPEDAYRCFMRTEMDTLVLENYVLSKSEQPEWKEKEDWREEFELD